MSEVRLRYTGLVTFFSRIFSVFTGLIFVVIVTRRLSPEDFGLWGIISVYLTYFFSPSRAIGSWVTRYAARGFNVFKTGVYVSTGLSCLGFLVFYLLAPYMAGSVGANVFYFLICSFQILVMPVISSLEAVAYGTKPYIQSYGFVAFELVRVVLGVLTVALLRLGLFGAMISVIFAQLLQAFFLLYLLRDKLAGAFSREMAKKLLALSWIPIYGFVSGLILSLDIVILSNLTGSTLPAAYVKAPGAVLGVISYSSLLAYALYPKLLEGGGCRDVETALKLVLLVAVPLTVGSLILAKPLLYVLRMEYAVTEDILRVLTVATFFSCISSVFDAIIAGTERIELREDATFMDYIKSKIFLLPTLSYVQAGLYVPSVFILTYYFVSRGSFDYVALVFYCALASTLTSIPLAAYKWLVAKRVMNFNFPWTSFAKFSAAAVVMAIFTFLFYPSGAYSEKIWFVLSNLLPVIAVGAIIYFSLVYAIDKDTKSLVNSTFAYLKHTLKGKRETM